MHTQVLDDSRPVVMVMKRLGLGSMCSGVECDAVSNCSVMPKCVCVCIYVRVYIL